MPTDLRCLPSDRAGIVFVKAPTLGMWALAALGSALLNMAFYAWKSFDLLIFDGPTPDEQATLGIYLSTWALLYAAASVAFVYGARRHSQRHLTPWMALGAAALIHALLGVPVLVAAFAHGGSGHALTLLGLNPLTYVACAPALVVMCGRGNWTHLSAKVTAGFLASALACPLLLTLVLGH